MTIFGWDASDYDHARGPMDVARAYREGVRFFTHKATGGTDPAARHHPAEVLARARDAGIPFLGCYMVVRTPAVAGNGDVDAQVNYFLKYVTEQVPWWRTFPGWFWQVDTERWARIGVPPIADPVPIEVGDLACRALHARTGRAVLHYAPEWAYHDSVPPGFPLWASSYVAGSGPFTSLYPGDGDARWHAYSGRVPAVLQYTSSATIAGQSPCDANAFRGTESQFATLITPIGAAMASAGYNDWVNAGRPDSGLARPLTAQANILTAHGYLVYRWPNDAHLLADPPEDHTQFSATGWPTAHPRWWRNAIDIMPPAAGARSKLNGLPLPTLQQLGQQYFNDKQADLPALRYLKYMNWGPSSNASAVHDSWMPGHARSSSGDVGHIHQSGYSTTVTSPMADTYDPVARFYGLPEEEQMTKQELVRGFQPDPNQIWLVDGMFRRPVPAEWVGTGNGPITNVQVHADSHLGNLSNNGAVFVSGGDPDVWGVDIRTLAADPTALAAALAPILAPMLDVDEQAVIDALTSTEGQAAIVSAVTSPTVKAAIVDSVNVAEDS